MRSGLFAFKTKDLDGSGVVDIADAIIVSQATSTNDLAADIDFGGTVDVDDLLKVIDEVFTPNPAQLLPGQYGLLSLEDPLRYNDGYELVALVAQPFQATPPSDPCAAERDAARLAALEWARHLKSPPGSWNPLDPSTWSAWNAWRERADMLRDRFHAAMAALNACLAGQGLPPVKPGDLLKPRPTTPPPPPPPPPHPRCRRTSARSTALIHRPHHCRVLLKTHASTRCRTTFSCASPAVISEWPQRHTAIAWSVPRPSAAPAGAALLGNRRLVSAERGIHGTS